MNNWLVKIYEPDAVEHTKSEHFPLGKIINKGLKEE